MSIQGFSVKASDQIVFACNAVYPQIVNHLLTVSQIPFAPIMGSYKGKTENAWVIDAENFNKILHLIDNEESVLILSGSKNSRNQRPAKLVFVDPANKPIDLGYWQETSKEIAMKQEGWSIWHEIQDNGAIVPRYYICAFNDLEGNHILE